MPSSIVNAFNKTRYPRPKFLQTWNKYGECPKGTIPIRRTLNNGTIHRKVLDDPANHEYATVHHMGNVKGAQAVFNVWKPQIERNEEFSLSQMWIMDRKGRDMNYVEAGWTVNYALFDDKIPRLFIFWTNDSYHEHYCYNLLCEAFVQTNFEIALGGGWEASSVYGGMQISHHIGIAKSRDYEGGDWWIIVGNELLGYYPRSLLPLLVNGGRLASFGGEIINLKTNNRHTITGMGSGSFSDQKYGRSCFISRIQVANDAFIWIEPHLQIEQITRPTCYDLTFGPSGTDMKTHFYFGGPGLNPDCQ